MFENEVNLVQEFKFFYLFMLGWDYICVRATPNEPYISFFKRWMNKHVALLE